MRRFKGLLTALLLLAVAPVVAQGETCPTIVRTALDAVGEICANTGRNQACYGNMAMQVTPQANAAQFKFDAVGDIVDAASIQTLRLSPLQESRDLWGVALLKLQANLPDTVPGQNVTVLLFGDVELTNAVSPDNAMASPMQAFYLRTGLGEASCAEAPQNGMLVQTPQGAGQVTFSVNGVDMALGSTVYFQATRGDHMNISTLKGSAAAVYGNRTFPALAGTRLGIPIGENYLPSGDPDFIEPYDVESFEDLPLELIGEYGEMIDIAEPFEDIDAIYDWIDSGGELCGQDPLPDCDEVVAALGGDLCPLADDGESFDCENLFDFHWGDDDLGFDFDGYESYLDTMDSDDYWDAYLDGELDDSFDDEFDAEFDDDLDDAEFDDSFDDEFDNDSGDSIDDGFEDEGFDDEG
jgi:hypothetical protein